MQLQRQSVDMSVSKSALDLCWTPTDPPTLQSQAGMACALNVATDAIRLFEDVCATLVRHRIHCDDQLHKEVRSQEKGSYWRCPADKGEQPMPFVSMAIGMSHS